MTENTRMSVPAGALGRARADARPSGDLAVRAAAQPPSAVRPGTGLPTARLRGSGKGGAVVGTAVAGLRCTTHTTSIDQYDGTTLGFHPSSRPLS